MKLASMLVVAAMATTLHAQTARTFVLKNLTDSTSELHVSLPTNPTGRAIVVCPGGGYSHLAFEHEGTDWNEYFNTRGIAQITLRYRMPKGNKNVPLSDAYQAIRTVRDSALSWGINPNDVGIMGSSAGGHLAATVSTIAPGDARPNFSILFYPVITLQAGTHAGTRDNFLGADKQNKDSLKYWSANNRVTHYGTPPALLLMTNDDTVVTPEENGVNYYTAMRKQGLSCTMHIYPTGGHGFGFRSNFKFHDEMLNNLDAWLKQLPSPKQDAIRVACIGNSITHGFGLALQAQTYPMQMQNMLGEDYWVRNFGRNSREMVKKGDHPYVAEEQWQLVQAWNPNIVVIKLGTNDSKPQNWKYADDFENDLQCMIDTLKALPSKPRIIICTPIKAFQSRWEISDSIIVNGIAPKLKNVAKANELELLDLHPVIADAALIQRDGIHPNRDGAKVIANAVAETIKNPLPVELLKKSKKRKK